MDLYHIRKELNSGKTIFDMPLRVTYYARVSTDKDEQLHSLSAQVRYFSDYIKKMPNWTFVQGYVDEGLSGTSVKKRENFLRMIADAREGKFDFIVTKEISRFSRNTLDSIQYTQELLASGVGVLFQSDNINTLMPDAELRLTIMSSIAQDEVRKISERVKFGFQRAIEKGVVLGSNKIWGYEKQEGKLVIVEEEAEMVRMVFDLYANQSMGVRTISNRLTELGYKNSNGNPFSYSTLSGIIKNPKYKGYYCGGKTSKYDYKLKDRKNIDPDQWVMYQDEENVPPIVSEKLWERANLIIEKRAQAQRGEEPSGYHNKYPYSGKIICAQHNTPYYRQLYRYKSGDKEVWQCQAYTRYGKAGCSAPVIYTTELDDMLRQGLEHVAIHREKMIQSLIKLYESGENQAKLEEHMNRCKTAIEEINRRKDKLLDLSIDGHISVEEFATRNQGFNQALEKECRQLEELKDRERQGRETALSIETLGQVIQKELNFDEGFSVGAMDSLLDKIVVNHTGEKGIITAKIYIKVVDEEINYRIERRRGKTSTCSLQYI